MGQGESNRMTMQLIEDILKDRGERVQIQEFLEFIDEICPRFSQCRTVDIAVWREVRMRTQQHYCNYGPESIPEDTPYFWMLIQERLDSDPDQQEAVPSALPEELLDTLSEQSSNNRPETNDSGLEREFSSLSLANGNAERQGHEDRVQREIKGLRRMVTSLSRRLGAMQIQDSFQKNNSLPTAMAGLDPPLAQSTLKVKQRHNDNSESPLQACIREVVSREEEVQGFQLFPVIKQRDAQGNLLRVHTPISFKLLKELKTACAQYGATASFTQTLVENIAVEALPPADWKQIAKACLSGGGYLLWKTEFTEQCQATAERNRTQQIPISYEMLAGKGPYTGANQQLEYNMVAYVQITTAAKKAWNKLPSSKEQTEELSRLRQGPDELFQDFVSRPTQASSKLIGDSEAAQIIIKQLAFENANAICKAAIRPFKKQGKVADYIRICSDIGQSYMQGMALAAALQGKTINDVLSQQGDLAPGKAQATGMPGGCFGCGLMGHQIRRCPDRRASPRTRREPGLCRRCRRGKHWTSE
ncbi:endogenous retrovirus group K member 5 Gag polyprotein-like [Chionomys nivalis]|uniref:endogenous retrovirus group K member 5 Gag polyprotein-like n=1 Tax=Chionomys nivalis TaxID=269649 RepID=UPI00259400C1|nr:endogenous retrovirus group K member 5 Gag polyprotein-like [Chionomys nivalis]